MEKQIKHIGILLNSFNLIYETDSFGKTVIELDSLTPRSNPYSRKTLFLFLGFKVEQSQRQYFIYHCTRDYSNDRKDKAIQTKCGKFFLFTTEGDNVVEFYPLDESIFKQNAIETNVFKVTKTYCGRYTVFSRFFESQDFYGLPFAANIRVLRTAEAGEIDEGVIDKAFFAYNKREGIIFKEEELLSYYYGKTIEKDYFNRGVFLFDYWNTKHLIQELEYNLHKAEEQVNRYDLQEILKDLEIEIEEFFINKIGDNDTYIVESTRRIGNDVVIDDYLKRYLGLGKVEIERRSGYCRAEELKNPQIKAGKLSEDEVDKIRNQLIEQYSRIEHINWVMTPPADYSRYMKTKSLVKKNQNLNLSFLFINLNRIINNHFSLAFHHGVKTIDDLIDKENDFLKDYTVSIK
jgi:hypothetical protein